MKYIKIFEDFKLAFIDIDYVSSVIGISANKININVDGTIDVDGDVRLDHKVGTSRKTTLPFKFGKVTGSFDIRGNVLTTLEGCPYYVGRNFLSNDNVLISLEGSPVEVVGNYSCNNNRLTSLVGMSSEIGGNFFCYGNPNLNELDSVSNIEGDILCDRHVDTTKFRGYCKEIRKS